MYTYDQHLWVTSTAQYRVKSGDQIVVGGRRIGSLGRLAAKLRQARQINKVERFWAALPGLPLEIREALLGIAAYQDGWIQRQEQAERAEEAERIASIGRFDF